MMQRYAAGPQPRVISPIGHLINLILQQLPFLCNNQICASRAGKQSIQLHFNPHHVETPQERCGISLFFRPCFEERRGCGTDERQ